MVLIMPEMGAKLMSKLIDVSRILNCRKTLRLAMKKMKKKIRVMDVLEVIYQGSDHGIVD
jgi:hypothetical protein